VARWLGEGGGDEDEAGSEAAAGVSQVLVKNASSSSLGGGSQLGLDGEANVGLKNNNSLRSLRRQVLLTVTLTCERGKKKRARQASCACTY